MLIIWLTVNVFITKHVVFSEIWFEKLIKCLCFLPKFYAFFSKLYVNLCLFFKRFSGFGFWTSLFPRQRRRWGRRRVEPSWPWCFSSPWVCPAAASQPVRTAAQCPAPRRTSRCVYCRLWSTRRRPSGARDNTWRLCSTGEVLAVTQTQSSHTSNVSGTVLLIVIFSFHSNEAASFTNDNIADEIVGDDTH